MMNVFVVELGEHTGVHRRIAYLERRIMKREREETLRSEHAMKALKAVTQQRVVSLERFLLPFVRTISCATIFSV